MKKLMSTKEVAKFLGVNEKMVYSLISEKGLPATKITGKWLFPQHLVEQWIEAHTNNYPEPSTKLPSDNGLLIIAGSNDPLLDSTISHFNNLYPDTIAVFGSMGSMGGLRALRQNHCHIASSHLLEENEEEYNFEFAFKELEKMPAVVNFCLRQQGILIQRDNPKNISSMADLVRSDLVIVNRPLGTGTRLLFDRELKKAEIDGELIEGYHNVLHKHLDIGLEIFSGRADVGPGIKAVAGLLNIGFIPLRWERYDLMIPKERFFNVNVQLFLDMLQGGTINQIAESFSGYDLKSSGKMVFQGKEK